MSEVCELSFCELRAKEVINALDGRRLGRIIDLLFSSSGGAISGIVVPYSRKISFFKSQDLFIPWECVKKIGEDVIIVEIMSMGGKPAKKGEHTRRIAPVPEEDCHYSCKQETPLSPPQKPQQKPQAPQCDRRCEKCMLFDCEYRWDRHGDSREFQPGAYVDKNYNSGSNSGL